MGCMGGGGDSGSSDALNEQKQLAQDQWNFYKELFQPEEMALAKQALAPVDAGATLGQIDSSINQARAFRDETMARELGRFGGSVEGRLGASLEDRTDLDMTRARVNARNAVRRRAPELRMERLGNVIQMGQGVPTEAIQGLGQVASNAAALQIAKNQAGVGMGAGIGSLGALAMAPKDMGGLGMNNDPGLIQQGKSWWQDRQTARLGQQALSSDWGASLANPWNAG